MRNYEFNGWAIGERFARAFNLIVAGYRKGRPIYTVGNSRKISEITHGR